jgi:hypothetical protein
MPGRAPRLFAYDRFGRRNSTFTLPFQPSNWLPTMAYDGTGNLFIHNYQASTYRLDIRTRVLTVLPTLRVSSVPGDMAFYANSIWFKDRGNILRYNISTGQLIGSWAWPSAGNSVPTGNFELYGFVSAGFGRFWVAGGTSPSFQLVLVDSGLRSWLSVAPESLHVPSGSLRSFSLTLRGDLVSAGSYSTQLALLSNDVDARTIIVSVSFAVNPAAPALFTTPTQAPARAPSSPIPIAQPPASAPVRPAPISRTSLISRVCCYPYFLSSSLFLFLFLEILSVFFVSFGMRDAAAFLLKSARGYLSSLPSPCRSGMS